jgi:SAM-dependent methyltransferase
MPPDHGDLVRNGYDLMAGTYLAAKDAEDPVLLDFLGQLVSGLQPDGLALDLGCGAGVPATSFLSKRCHTIGMDFSAAQITLAEQLVPEATFVLGDMTEMDFPSGSFDVVCALWSIIHVARELQPRLLQDVFDVLKPGGKFLATWALSDWEGEDPDWNGWGAPMWWSHFGAEENVRVLRAAGFLILKDKTLSSGTEQWLWVLAQRPL